MTDISIPQGNTAYQEDVSTLAAGSAVVTKPCVVWSIVATSDTSGVGILSISNDSATYSSANKKGKIVLSGAVTQTVNYGKGKYFSSGVCVQANKASCNIEIIYD